MQNFTRRHFLKGTSLAGLGIAGGFPAMTAIESLAAPSTRGGFLAERTKDSMLFPRPADGVTVACSPPGLGWLPAEGAHGYKVEIRAAQGQGRLIYEKSVGKDPVHLPDEVLAPGKYKWDVIALNADGKEMGRRGALRFQVARDATRLPWIQPEELLARIPKEHARLLYPRHQLDSLRQTLETSRKRAWQNCLRRAERALDRPAPKYPEYHLTTDPVQRRLEYGRYFSYIRGFIDSALMDLSLAYLMTEEKNYATAAKRILMELTRWPTDDQDVTSVSARWGDEPGLSFSKCAHFAYDWLYHAFDDQERAAVLKMCEARAWQTHRRLVRHNYLTYPGNSHEGRLIAYLSDMAVAMAGESKGAPVWLEYSLKALTTFYPHWGGADGGWAEGAPYGLWYNSFYIPAFESLRQLAGYDLWQRDFFNNVRHFFFYCTALRGEIRPFGDSAEKGGPGVKGGSGYANLMWHHAHRFADPHVGWWVNQIRGWSGPSGVGALLFPEKTPEQAPTTLPGSKVFRGVGWAGLHSDLSRPDEDTCLLFKSSPYGSVSHSHADQNSFAIMKGGQALAIPSGYYGPSYGMPHHAKWTRSTKANNCILVDGQGQVVRSAKAQGRVVEFEERKGVTYVVGDAAQAYLGKLKKFDRHILFMRPCLFLVLDVLQAPRAARFQWMLHAFDEMELGTQRIVSRRGGAELEVRLQSAAGLSLAQSDQFDTPYNQGIPKSFQRDMPNHWHVTAETKRPSESVRIAAVMAVRGAGEVFKMKMLKKEGWFGARASGKFGEVEGWIQLAAATRGPDGYGKEITSGRGKLCGRAADGETFAA